MAEDSLSFSKGEDSHLQVRLGGTLRLRGGLPTVVSLEHELNSAPRVESLAFDASELQSWVSSVLAFLVEASALCRSRSIQLDRAGLPSGLQRLVDLAEAVPEKQGARKETHEAAFLEFLVLPRVIALVLMMPLLCLYSDFIGVLGGAAIRRGHARSFVDDVLPPDDECRRFGRCGGRRVKASIYGILTALSGYLRRGFYVLQREKPFVLFKRQAAERPPRPDIMKIR